MSIYHPVYQTMLNDLGRNSFFKSAIEKVVKDKIVLDVGCGTGILSWYALKAGAKHVYAIDRSKDAVDYTKELLKKKFSKDQYTVLSGDFLSNDFNINHVDVIVSETIGLNIFEEDIAKIWERAIFLFPAAKFIPSIISCDGYLYEINDLDDAVYGNGNSFVPEIPNTLLKENILDDEFYDVLSTIERKTQAEKSNHKSVYIQGEQLVKMSTIANPPFKIVKDLFVFTNEDKLDYRKDRKSLPIVNFDIDIPKPCILIIVYNIKFEDYSFTLYTGTGDWVYCNMYKLGAPGHYTFKYNGAAFVDDSIWHFIRN